MSPSEVVTQVRADPWHRTRFVYLLIGLPAASLVMATIFAVIAFRVFDGVVVDDYYRRGKTINLVLARDREAARRGLQAAVEIDPATAGLKLRLSEALGPRGDLAPSSLELAFLHATRAGWDRRVAVARSIGDDVYHGVLPELAPGKYHLQLETPAWRIVGELRPPHERTVTLTSRARPLRGTADATTDAR